MEKFEAAVFEKDELEYREMSKVKALLPLLTHKNSDSKVEKNSMNFKNI